VVDTNGNVVGGLQGSDFAITVSGSAAAGAISETATEGIYTFDVTNTVAETVTVTVTASGTELSDQPQIVFESNVPEPVPPVPDFISIQNTENGIVLNWQISSEEFVAAYNIYRGESSLQLDVIDEVSAGSSSFTDSDPLEGSIFYAISAVNNEGVEGMRSSVLSAVNETISATANWQLISIPVQENEITSDLATIFSYEEKYNVTNTLRDSKGYWIKTRTFDTETIQVKSIGLDQTVIPLNSGWNLIGSVSDTIPVASIIDTDGILSGAPVYIYNENQYQVSEVIVPNKGHWIYANEPGSIELEIRSIDSMPGGTDIPGIVHHSQKSSENSLPSIQFSVNEVTADVYVSDYYLSDEERNNYALPPVAPDPVLDVRSASESALIKTETGRIRIQASEYPVRAEVKGLDEEENFIYRLILGKKGKKRSIDLIPGQVNEIGTDYDTIYLTKVDTDELITEHKLYPNYPNPFNPETTIQYQVREQSHVKIEVFDVVGRRVKLLADEVKFSGEYQVNFDARDLSSGIYIIRFIAGNHIDIRKMTLIK
jgi:hypothetical protein